MGGVRRGPRKFLFGRTSVVAAMVAGVLVGAPAAAEQANNDCPEVFPIEDLEKGMTGYGVTVADGHTRTTFGAEILGVLEDALAPGRDLIIVETSGPEIERAGGIWFGMSGSPVYVDNKLVGAVAFGLSFGSNAVGAMTPAGEMMRVLDYPSADDSSRVMPNRARIDWPTRRTIAHATGTTAGRVGGSFVRLKTPVGVSGLPDRAMAKLNGVVEREDLPIIPYAANSASGDPVAAAPSDELHPGDNFAAALAYGDVTFAGIGTVTIVCDEDVMAFGHPFFWEGSTTLGANQAETITVIKDPLFGSYELATIEEPIALVDQDRLAGIRAEIGTFPSLIPINSHISSVDTGREREGLTEAVTDEVVPFVSFFHAYTNIIATVDEQDEGSAATSWTVRGTTGSGQPWELTRNNKYVSEYDIAGDSSYELERILGALYFNEFEDIEFSSIDLSASVHEEVRRYTLTDVLVSTDGITFEDKRRVRVRRGSTIALRILLTASDGSPDRSVDLSVQVPRRARFDGVIEISGGQAGDSELCFFIPEECFGEDGNEVDSFEALLASLEGAPTNDELGARLKLGPRNRVRSSDSELLDRVVSGRLRVRVLLPASGRGAGGGAPGGRRSG